MSTIVDATVVIVTKDRRDEALRAVGSAVEQSGSVETLVLDDGSTDGTAEAILSSFPGARVERFAEAAGYIVRRNQAAELAHGSVIVSLDDDAEFTTSTVVAETLADFDHPRVGAVAIPLIDLPQGEGVLQRAPDDSRAYVTPRFIGTSHAVRRDLFLALDGYRTSFLHQAEEDELCLRMLQAGFVVRLGRSDPIRHYGSPKRDIERMWFFGRRNDILAAWHNVPMPYLATRLFVISAHALWLSLGVRRPGLFARGLLSGYRDALRARRERRPVSRAVYRLHRRLSRQPATPLDDVVEDLP